MILICDLLCKSVSHEKVNSGFLRGVNLAFPGEKIIFFADKTHINAIQKILDHDGVIIDSLEYRPINTVSKSIALLRLFQRAINNEVDKLFFLSFSEEILLLIKLLKKLNFYSNLKFALVLHGGFEGIANDSSRYKMVLPINSFPVVIKSDLIRKLTKTNFKKLPSLLFRKTIEKITSVSGYKKIKLLSIKKVIEMWNSDDYHYIALSPHVVSNAARYINTNTLKIYSLILPTNFSAPNENVKNTYVKFATFGFSDSLVLFNVADLLSKRAVTKPYEIRVIGMDDRGAAGFSNIISTSEGKVLSRERMEFLAKDIDAFLILYDKSRYRLSCSGSILESLSLTKPIIHFDNDCINYFNKEELPIGYCCSGLNEYVDKLVDIIENYDHYHGQFKSFRKNIAKLREDYDVERFLPQLRASFSW